MAQLSGSSFALEPIDKDSQPAPVWYQPFFLDLFADEYKSKLVGAKDPFAKTSAVSRMRHSLYVVKTALKRINANEQEGEGEFGGISSEISISPMLFDLQE